MHKTLLLTALLTLSACQAPPATQTPSAPNADSAHNSQNALDWPGRYRGTVPCADCSGIDTELTLSANGEYRLVEHYQGHPDTFTEQGRFQWLPDGQRIQLNGKADGQQYFVGENRLWMLDADGNRIEGELSDHYQLEKTAP